MIFSLIIITLLVLLIAVLLYKLIRKRRGADTPPTEEMTDDIPYAIAREMGKQPANLERKYHAHKADEPPDGKGKRDIDYRHDDQRSQIIAVHNQRGDLIEPASQRPQKTQGQGMGLPAHPLTSNGPQGVAPNLSNDVSVNPEAEENAGAHPENTPVPTAELHNQAVASAGAAPTPVSKPG